MLNYVSPQVVLFTITPFAPASLSSLDGTMGLSQSSCAGGFSSGNVTHMFPAEVVMYKERKNS